MKRIIIATAVAILAALPNAAGGQTRDNIMARVIWPCVGQNIVELDDLQADVLHVAKTMIFVLHRDYFDGVMHVVETVFREYTDEAHMTIYRAGFEICILYHPVLGKV